MDRGIQIGSLSNVSRLFPETQAFRPAEAQERRCRSALHAEDILLAKGLHDGGVTTGRWPETYK